GWPDVFGFVGTTDWQDCSREYAVPKGAKILKIAPCNLGASGTVEFQNISLKVSRVRSLTPEDAPSPVANPFDLSDAWREKTVSRESICLNGFWMFQQICRGGEDAVATPGCWGWFRVPGIWPNSVQEMEITGGQKIRMSSWYEEKCAESGGAAPFDQAWYKREIEVPADWEGRRIVIEFTMLQTHARAFVDGKEAGEIWFPGGELDLTDALVPGQKHELTLLVTARPLAPDLESFSAPERVSRTKATVKFKGITGDVFLKSMPKGPRIEDVRIITEVSPEKTVEFVIKSHELDKEKKYSLSIAITSYEKKYTRGYEFLNTRVRGDNNFLNASLPLHDSEFWDIDSPNMYHISIIINGNGFDDEVTTVTGFRDMEIRGRDFYLNGTPIHLRTLINETMKEQADKANKDAALELIRRMKEYGFNSLIFGNYDFTPGAVGYMDGLLDACDETGMLVAFSLPHIKDFDYRLDKPENAAAYEALTRWLIKRVRNRPSVVLYAMNHNATGYFGDQNPLKIDGVYAPENFPDSDKSWSARNRRQALIAESIARPLDPTRPIYHHQSGNLGDMHTVNCYLNWAPRQERSDWFAHWSRDGEKPLFLVEWGLPHISSWSSYRGPEFIWTAPAYQSLWAAEFAAEFWGDAAYRDDATAIAALRHEEKLWARGAPFHWWELNTPLRDLEQNYSAVQAHFADDNWRSFRAWGVSAMLPWDQSDLWRRVAPTVRRDLETVENSKHPGIIPDRISSAGQFIYDPGSPDNFTPTALGESFKRWNQPDCMFIAGPTNAFTTKDHVFRSGETVEKSIVIINDRRVAQTVVATASLPLSTAGMPSLLTIPPGSTTFVPITFTATDSG
ncbi:MAG: hypothetical protein FWG05_06395, partial [Kiritimatiellaeota bacterium]|nr:hypothetical protein [Kiritimatiellota bacterium]